MEQPLLPVLPSPGSGHASRDPLFAGNGPSEGEQVAQAGMSGALGVSMGRGLDGMGRSWQPNSSGLFSPAPHLTPRGFPSGIAAGAGSRPLLWMVSVGERNKAKGSPALEGGSAPSPHPRPGVGLTRRKVSLPWHCCPGTRSCFMCREPGMSAQSRSHGGSSCGDFTFGSWQFVGARQEAEELQTHSAPRCWQLLPGSELVKCSFIGLPFPTGTEQEALEGRVAFPSSCP